MAGALGVRLGGSGSYWGATTKFFLGDPLEPLGGRIRRAVVLMALAYLPRRVVSSGARWLGGGCAGGRHDGTGGRVRIHHDGKGKTTAALASLAGKDGMRVLVLQFVKAGQQTGALAAARRLPGFEIAQRGRGFVPDEGSPQFAAHRQAAADVLREADEALLSGTYDVVVLDELCLAVAKNLLPEQAALDVVSHARPGTVLVLTGRGATPGLIAAADTVTEMCLRKHGMQSGIHAQRGVEY
jgi:cob(I)alamin adenosyltransferase